MNRLFEELIGAFGVSGHESEIRNVIIEHLNSLGIENNLFINNTSKSIVFLSILLIT